MNLILSYLPQAALDSFPLLSETEDLKPSPNPSFISSFDRVIQDDSYYGGDSYYAREPFASDKQDDSYYGGDSYGAPLSPVISTAPAAYDYGTGWVT